MGGVRRLWRDHGVKFLWIIAAALAGYWLPPVIDRLDTNWRYAFWGFVAGVLVSAVAVHARDRRQVRWGIERADEQRLANQRREVSASR